jgi:ABC-type glycerol-3-phosphate transport system substrate-binding protein
VRKRKVLAICAVLILAVAMLAGGQGKVALNMWMQDWPGGIAFVGAFNDYYVKLHPNVTIDWTLIGWSDLGQKIIPAVIAGKEPDIMFGYSEWFIGQNVSRLFLKLTPEAFAKSEMSQFIYPSAFEKVSSIMGPDGEIYGVPWRMGPDYDMITVNMEMAKSAGVDITKIKTWDDILAISKKMTQYNADGSIKVSGISLDNYWTLCQGYITMVRQLGGNPLDAKTAKWDFDNAAGLKAIEILDQFVRQKIWDPKSGSALDAFTKKLAASFFIGPWYSTYALGTYPNMKLDLYQVPAINNNAVNLVPSIQMMAFSKRLTGDKKAAVLAYAKELIKPKFMELYANNDAGIGVILNKVFVDNFKAGKYKFKDQIATTLVARSVAETDKFIPYIKPIPHNTTFDQWAQIMTPEFQKVFMEGGSYKDFVKAISAGLSKAEQEKGL